MKFFKKTKGITLVALVVTIIILLILAGITISQLTGSGLFQKVQLAKEKYENAAAKETEYLESLSNLSVNTSVSGDRDTVTMSRTELINLIKEYSNPTGTIIAYSTGTVPDGYLECNGQEVSRTTYSDLFAIIGTTYGSGDGSTTFKIPDLRGEFLRGTGTNSHANQGSGQAVGTHRDATQILRLNYEKNSSVLTIFRGADEDLALQNADTTLGNSLSYSKLTIAGNTVEMSSNGYGLITTRPTNTSVLYCIKYK